MADTHTYEFNITMSCGGCSGVESYDVSLENQTAKVVTALPYDTVLQKIAKTGKKVNSGKADGVDQSVEVAA
ncbi:antioxidant and metal homeostasis factor [Fusarium agapanthi]|uniref:Antioxidant and metal homeostasis factor n=1 Tax=Fusarium agapanthi TaxID=1803897 RepID=A0A9P5E8D5_9HYPO|nr:antioxidant and metal homeostasis factor [Fusarium agapanthi]